MLKIQIETTMVDTKAGTSAKTGKPYCIREQEGWMFGFDRGGKQHPYPQRILLTLDDDQQPYPVGTYQLCPSSIYVDRFSQIAIRAKLRTTAQAVPAQPKAA
jgi:hypothetical protein